MSLTKGVVNNLKGRWAGEGSRSEDEGRRDGLDLFVFEMLVSCSAEEIKGL